MYIVNLPVAIGGRDYHIGETIPDERVQDPRALVQAGFLAKAPDLPPPTRIQAPCPLEDGSWTAMELEPADAEKALRFLLTPAAEACRAAASLSPGPLLDYLCRVEQRKTVRPALEKQKDGDMHGEPAGESGAAGKPGNAGGCA